MQLLGLHTRNVSDLMTVMKMCVLFPFPSFSPRAPVIDCGGYELQVQGEGGPVEWLGTPVLWHEICQEAGSQALHRLCRGQTELPAGAPLIRPCSRLLCALPCKFCQVPPCRKPQQWFLRWGNSIEIEKTFALLQATGFRWENASPFAVGPGILDSILTWGQKACFSPTLTKVAVC